jgi:hypothetical protein
LDFQFPEFQSLKAISCSKKLTLAYQTKAVFLQQSLKGIFLFKIKHHQKSNEKIEIELIKN